MNKARFKGTSLYWLLYQPFQNNIQRVFATKNFNAINDYHLTKRDEFLKFYQFIRQKLPLIWGEYPFNIV